MSLSGGHWRRQRSGTAGLVQSLRVRHHSIVMRTAVGLLLQTAYFVELSYEAKI